MAEFSIDRFVDRYAARAAGMTASEVRALFAVASRPEVVSLAGGMPYVQALPGADVMAVARTVLEEHGDVALQYGGGQGSRGLRERLVMLMAEEGIVADPEDVVVTTGAQQALDLVGKLFIDPGDVVAVEAPAYVGALTAFGAYQPRFLPIEIDDDGMLVEAARAGPRARRAAEVRVHGPQLREPGGRHDVGRAPAAPRGLVPRGVDPDRRGQPVRAAAVRRRGDRRVCGPSTRRT